MVRMKAIRISVFSADLDNLRVEDVPYLPLAAEEARVRVMAACINPSDVKNVQGKMEGTTLPRIPGRDFAGIFAVGSSGVVRHLGNDDLMASEQPAIERKSAGTKANDGGRYRRSQSRHRSGIKQCGVRSRQPGTHGAYASSDGYKRGPAREITSQQQGAGSDCQQCDGEQESGFVFTHHAGNAPNDKQNANRRSQEQQPGTGPSVWKRGEYSEQCSASLLL